MTWKAFHNRGEVLRSVIATADDRRDGILPMDVAGVSETFRDELDLLSALQLKWRARLLGNIENLMLHQPMDLPEQVALGWSLAAQELPGVRLILDHYRANPIDDAMAVAMLKSTAKEHHFLAVMAGRSALGNEAAAQIGAQLEEDGRNILAGIKRVTPHLVPGVDVDPDAPRLTLRQRLRAVMAA